MVEFCVQCGTSLPKGDLSFLRGKMFTSGDFLCPHCGKPANPNAPGGHAHAAPPQPTPENDLIIKKGKANLE